jgi:hypothetical protein
MTLMKGTEDRKSEIERREPVGLPFFQLKVGNPQF